VTVFPLHARQAPLGAVVFDCDGLLLQGYICIIWIRMRRRKWCRLASA
jgi:hypothetical protein